MQDDLQIVPNYLTGIKMNWMPNGMDMSADAIHLEADVHATEDEKHGFSKDTWIPYLNDSLTVTKQEAKFKKTGTLAAMTAGDGPHYANNVAMDGPGTYELTYEILPPSSNGSTAISTRRPARPNGGSRSPRTGPSPIRVKSPSEARLRPSAVPHQPAGA